MAKKGYVSRSDIENALIDELIKHGATASNASIRARSFISDYKKQLSAQPRLILNADEIGKEQYRTQELGEWLYSRKGVLSEFRTPICPFKKTFEESISESMEVGGATNILTPKEAKNPAILSTKLLMQEIEYEKKLKKLEQENKEFKEKSKATTEKRISAGKSGGRGRSKF